MMAYAIEYTPPRMSETFGGRVRVIWGGGGGGGGILAIPEGKRGLLKISRGGWYSKQKIDFSEGIFLLSPFSWGFSRG